jgi:hypothetical protein
LVAPLVSAQQAGFVVAQISHALGQKAERMSGPDNDSTPSASAPLKFLGLVIPLAIVGALMVFFQLTTAEVSGTLKSSGALGSWSLTPSECTSGQHEGFAGVSLSSEQSPTVIRIVSDPMRGDVLVVVRPGTKNVVLDGTSCSRFQLRSHRTDTNVNEIWLVDGSLEVNCPELSGAVTFSGCQ